MQYFNATEAKQNFGAVLQAAQRAPVGIRSHNKDTAYIISPDDYEKLRQLKIAEFQEFCEDVSAKATESGLTEEVLQEMMREGFTSVRTTRLAHQQALIDQAIATGESNVTISDIIARVQRRKRG